MQAKFCRSCPHRKNVEGNCKFIVIPGKYLEIKLQRHWRVKLVVVFLVCLMRRTHKLGRFWWICTAGGVFFDLQHSLTLCSAKRGNEFLTSPAWDCKTVCCSEREYLSGFLYVIHACYMAHPRLFYFPNSIWWR